LGYSLTRAAKNKCLAQINKFRIGGKATKPMNDQGMTAPRDVVRVDVPAGRVETGEHGLDATDHISAQRD
jgi:hypothetical protein